MAKAAGRQAGKIRLQEGGEKFGRKHIELRRGEEIKQAGFDSIESFVREIASNIDQVWKPEKTRQLVAIQSTGNNRILFVELQPEENGGEDFYTVKTAYTSRQGGKHDDVVIVQSFADLPSDVKRAIGLDGTGEGDFNALHYKGKSYIVADAMNTAVEVEQAVFHEHFTHGGLRAKYGRELGAKLDNMLFKIGGIEGVRLQAKKQGIDLKAYETALANRPHMDAQTKKRILMEELLAHMSATTGTLKRRLEEVLGAIRQWLRDNGFAELSKLSTSDIAHTLKQAREAVTRQQQTSHQSSPVYARTNPPTAFSPKIGEADKFRGNLRKMMRSLRTKEPAITVTSTPKVFQALGVSDAPITISRDVVRKATNGVKHNVPMVAIEHLPEELNDPLAVFKSSTEQDALVVLTELSDESNRPIIVALDLRKANGEYGIVRVASAYGKDVIDDNWVRKNVLAYKSKRATGSHLLKQVLVHESSALKGVQFPNSTSDTSGSLSGKALTEDDILSNDDAPVMFSRISDTIDALKTGAERVAGAADKWANTAPEIPGNWTDAQKAAASKFDTFRPKQPFTERLKTIKNFAKDKLAQKIFDQYLKDGAIAVRTDNSGFIGAMIKLGGMEEVRKFLMWVAAIFLALI
ncbi:MAG: hypothetical protein WAO12_02565 [Venatoribacter sp.]